MQDVSAVYKRLLKDKNHRKESKIEIAGTTFGIDKLISLRTYGGLYVGSASIGKTASRQIDVSLFAGDATIPKMAEIKVFVRLVTKNEVSEWIPKGVFYIYTREFDKDTGVLTIHGYDAMLKAEQVFLTETTEDDWPQPMVDVVDEIAEVMGVPIDPRTNLDSRLLTPYPLDYTMREILGYVAIANGGNWIITDAGYLRLVGLADDPGDTNYLVDEYGNTILFGNTRILV